MRIHCRRGYSLTEAMLVVAILGILVWIAPELIKQSNRFFFQNRARSAIQREARSMMYVISRNLHQAQAQSVRIDRATDQPYCSRITFTKVQGTSMSFYQNGRSLVQQSGTTTKILSTNLRYLAFTFPRSDDLGIVSISLTLDQGTYEGQSAALHMASEKVRVMN